MYQGVTELRRMFSVELKRQRMTFQSLTVEPDEYFRDESDEEGFRWSVVEVKQRGSGMKV